MPSHLAKATMAATALASTSNILAQVLESYRDDSPFALDMGKLTRFALCALISAPPNYLWQVYLERMFPAYAPSSGGRRAAKGSHHSDEDLRNRDIEKHAGGSADDWKESGSKAAAAGHGNKSSSSSTDGKSRSTSKPRLNMRNTLTKWFLDCITLGAIFNTVLFFTLMGLLKQQPLGHIAANIRTETIPIIIAGYKIWPIASIISFTCVPVERRIVFLNFVGLLWGIYMSLVATRV